MASAFLWLREMYWMYKYRKGRTITFCFGYDGFTEVLIVDNRIRSTGTVLYRERGINVFADQQHDFGPICESTIPDLIKKMRCLEKADSDPVLPRSD